MKHAIDSIVTIVNFYQYVFEKKTENVFILLRYYQYVYGRFIIEVFLLIIIVVALKKHKQANKILQYLIFPLIILISIFSVEKNEIWSKNISEALLIILFVISVNLFVAEMKKK